MPNNITVEIYSSGELQYILSPSVKQGDTVTFRVMDIIGDVTVSFDSVSCLTPPGPYTLNGGSPMTASSSETVSATALKGLYPFTVMLADEPRRRYHEWETKRGELDVTTDPPKDEVVG